MMTNSTLKEGGYEFNCPGCDHKWDFNRMRDLLSASMTAVELAVIQKQVDENYIRQPKNDIRQCGTCGTYSQRDNSKRWYSKHRAVCHTCSKRARHTVEFCWYCGQQWKSGNAESCGNSNCTGPASSLQVLANCKSKTIGRVSNVPDTRACPKCGILITHMEKCKHIDCTACGCSFCFVCLKMKNDRGNWQCGGYNDACPVAERQTVIPEYLR